MLEIWARQAVRVGHVGQVQMDNRHSQSGHPSHRHHDGDLAGCFAKEGKSPEDSRAEQQSLEALAGPGVVPLWSGSAADHPGCENDAGVVLQRAACSLADVLARAGPLTEAEVRAVGVAAAEALERVHGAGMIHGDLKPSNLLLSHDAQLWLADFDSAAPADASPLRRGTPRRTPAWGAATPGLDISALGLTLVELATGFVLDPDVAWSVEHLQRLGCAAALGADIAFVLKVAHQQGRRPGTPSAAEPSQVGTGGPETGAEEPSRGETGGAGSLARLVKQVLSVCGEPLRLPVVVAAGRGHCEADRTVDFTLHTKATDTRRRQQRSPLGVGGGQGPAFRERRGGQPSVSQASRSSWVSRLTTRRAAPSATNTTAGRSTLL